MKKVIFDVDGVLLSEKRYFDVSALVVWEWYYSPRYMHLKPERITADLDLRLRRGEQWQYEPVQLVLRAVVRVQGDVDAVVLGDLPREGDEAQ